MCRRLLSQGRDSFFVVEYAKKDKDNIDSRELKILNVPVNELLTYGENEIDENIESGEFIQVFG